MARYTQNDLRKMYEAPPQELTEQIHESISLLPLREQEERSMKRKLSLSTVIAIAMVIVLMATALAAATNDTINDLVYRVWPDLALTLKPVNLACTDQGIKVEVVSAVAGNNEIVITYTAQDLLGDRLGSGGSAFGDIDTDFVETPDPSIEAEGEGEGFANFSTEEGKIIGAARMVWNTNGIAEGDYITFSLQSVDPGREILSSFDPRPYLAQADDQIRTSPLPETLWDVDGPYSYDRRFPDDLRIIDWSQSQEIPLEGSVTLSGAGYFGGRLHVQVHNTNPGSPWLYSLDLQNNNPLPDYSDGSYVSSIRWGGSGSSPEWVETFVPASQEYLENADLTAVLIRYMPPINGLWEIKIPARMIKVSD